MCGIVGGISLRGSFDFSAEIGRMNKAIAHRGPDSEGTYMNEAGTVCFGHRRLAILDLSELGHQPMKIGQFVICYNGEVYNYVELRAELEAAGVGFNSHTDTEVILQAYIHWGDAAIAKLNGMWAFAIYDEAKQEVFCSRDRYGIKPFYYTEFRNRLYFASEIKAFLQIEGWESILNQSRAFDFLAHSLVSHTSETMLQGVIELRGGYNLRISLQEGKYEQWQYYQLEKISYKSTKSEAEHIQHFKALFRDAVRIALRSDVKVGSALSGGLDSSSIVAIVNEQLREVGQEQKQECVSAVYTAEDKGIDESLFIDLLAIEKQVKVHKTQPSWEHLMANLDKLVWHQDEPFSTLSIYAQYTVFEEAARNKLIVMLDGQGADEILAGYESFYEGYFKELLRYHPYEFFPALLGYFIKHKKYPFKIIFDKFFNKESNINWFTDKFINNSKPYKRNRKLSVRGMSEDYLEHFGLHSLLKFEDRNSMAFSIESRVPFLDFRIVEYALNAPTSLKIRKGIRKYILRKAFQKILPKAIYNRYDKLGFPTPQERWTKQNVGEVNSMLQDALLELKDILNLSSFDSAEALLRKGDKDFIFFAWRIIIFARWKKLYQVKINIIQE
jgi:asparagine synthase (glutamine-hydrolysing)